MMTMTGYPSIAIVDLDGKGLIIDTTLRDQEAHARVQAKIQSMSEPPTPDEYKQLFYSGEIFYDPALLALDRLNPGAKEALDRLQERYTDVYILTARPDFLAVPTEEWLHAHGIIFPRESIRYKLYPDGEEKREQRLSTAAWKATIVHQAAVWHKRVLFIDDDERNRQAVIAHRLSNVEIKDSLADYIFDDTPIII
jgi:phosphoglycolate phosphatase-like HAD superfamily hydrolase